MGNDIFGDSQDQKRRVYPLLYHRKTPYISSTNVLEQIDREIGRRSKVVSIFSSRESYIRLIATYLMEYKKNWEIERSYIRPDKLQEVMDIYDTQRKVT